MQQYEHLMEHGSRYYECAACDSRVHVAPSAPADYVPPHAAGDDCKGSYRPIKRAAFMRAEGIEGS